MGTGKSTWAIKYINDNPDKKFLCVVPLLEECERYKNSTNIDIVNPEKWGTKWNHFKWLVEKEKNIVTTHSLIQKMDLDMLEMLKSRNYVLMIDECLDVIETYKISKDDLNIIFNENLVFLDDQGFLIWNEKKQSYKGVHEDIKRLCSFRSLMGFKKEGSEELAKIIMWNFPVDFFKCFDESYIFTYMWDGSIQKSYFDIHGIEYERYMLDENKDLIPYSKSIELMKRSKVVGLIDIYEGKLNAIGEKIAKVNPLSKSWFEDKRKRNMSMLDKLKRNTEGYFRRVTKTKSNDNMYTVFKNYQKYVKGEGYTKGFVPCNARGTNSYKNKKSLAYLINFFLPPDIKLFVEHYGFEFDEDRFALSALLQWIWRSQVRNGKPVRIYIPSERMRNLLKDWIEEVS